MKKYLFSSEWRVQDTVEVEAESLEEAERKVLDDDVDGSTEHMEYLEKLSPWEGKEIK